MIANPKRNRPSASKLIAAVAGLLVASWALPSSAAAATPDQGQIVGMTQLLAQAGDKSLNGEPASDQAGAEQAPAKKKKLSEKEVWKKASGVPELPALPHFLAKIMPKKKHTIHKWMWVIRPVYALVIVTLVFLVLMGVYRKRSILPTRMQTAMEMLVEGLDNLICGILGEKHGRKYLPYLGALFLYIVCLNWFGQVPLMMSPSSFFACTLGLAICTFFVVQYTAFTKLGVKGVVGHWAGDPKDVVGYCVAILLIPLHIFGEFLKPLSLGLRLYGNIYGEDVLLGSMLMLGIMIFSFLPANGIPLGFPLMLPFQFLALLLSTIQALVFTLLSTIYILMVLPHDDHEHEEHAETHA